MDLTTYDLIDLAASRYIDLCWEEGLPKVNIQDLLAGLQYYVPTLKGNLQLSWSLLAAWNRHEMPTRAVPFTPILLAAFCGGLVRAGHPQLALLSVFGFSSLARTGELLTIERQDVFFGEGGAVVSFRLTKRGQRLGVDEGLVIEDEITLLCLRLLCHGLAPGDKLCRTTERQMRSVWAHVAQCLKLGPSCRPYSLRRGGATHLYRLTGSLHRVAQAGRWASLTTTRRYVSDATAALTTLALDPDMAAEYDALATEFRRYLHNAQ